MRNNEKGPTLVQLCIIFGSICMLGVVVVGTSIMGGKYEEKTKYLQNYLSIQMPKNQQTFTAFEIDFLRPVVEKELQKYYNNLQNAQIAIDKIRKTGGEITIDEANESLENLRRAQISEKCARYNLAKACEAAKYFKLVPEDCEPCKVVK